jgi:putative membrane protein
LKAFLIKWLVNIIALVAVASFVPGISADKWQTVAAAALVLGLINAFLRPLIMLFTLPLNILSFGLFTFLINAFFFYLVSKIVSGFEVIDFRSAFFGALLFSFISFILSILLGSQGHADMRFYQKPQPGGNKYKDVIDVEGSSDAGKKNKDSSGQEDKPWIS